MHQESSAVRALDEPCNGSNGVHFLGEKIVIFQLTAVPAVWAPQPLGQIQAVSPVPAPTNDFTLFLTSAASKKSPGKFHIPRFEHVPYISHSLAFFGAKY